MAQSDELVAALKQHTETPASGFAPLYHRVERAIRSVIEDGHLGDDDALPPERDLAKALGISRVTVRNAIRSLVNDGVLVQRRGAGTFVTRRVELPLTRPTSFSEDMRARGMKPQFDMLDRNTGAAMPVEAEMLQMEPGTLVTRLYRLLYANGKPMCLELATVPAAVLPADTKLGDSLYSHLEARDMRPARAVQRLRAELLEMEQARLLGVPPGSAGLFVEQQSFLKDGRPIEYVRSHYRGDSYDFVAELKI